MFKQANVGGNSESNYLVGFKRIHTYGGKRMTHRAIFDQLTLKLERRVRAYLLSFAVYVQDNLFRLGNEW